MNKIFDGKRYWLLDGAMGTMLQKSGLKLGERPDLLSITHPDVVERINRAYVEAGSDLICANTFGSNAKKLAEKEQVDIKTYSIIYEAIDDVKAAMSGLLAPDIKESEQGQAEVRNVIKVPKVGNIAGCYITDGKITRHSKIRVLRDGIVIYDGEIASLKRFKDDVREVASGYECGISLERYNDFKEGDILEAYVLEEIKREL